MKNAYILLPGISWNLDHMIVIDDILISKDVLEEHFLCNLSACKGACCWEGDWGAPLEQAEIDVLEKISEYILPYLSDRSKKVITEEGGVTYYDEPGFHGTKLHNDGSCVYLTLKDGKASCGIEQAWQDGVIPFRKPISCHLYPIRVTKNEETGFHAMNYDKWDICSAACTFGKENKVRLYEFAREAITRAYGPEFYDSIENASRYLDEQS